MKKVIEKFGRKASPTDASPEVKQMFQMCEEGRTNMKKISERFCAYLKKNLAAIEEGRGFAEVLQQYGQVLSDPDSNSILGSSLISLAEMFRNEEDARTDYYAHLTKHVCGNIDDFLEEEEKNAQDIKRTYDKARTAFESLRRVKRAEFADEDDDDDDASFTDTSQQFKRLDEITDETVESLKLLHLQNELRALSFVNKLVSATYILSSHLHDRVLTLQSSLGESAIDYLYKETENYELATGKSLITLNADFVPSWASEVNLGSGMRRLSYDEIRKRKIVEMLKKERAYVGLLKSITKIYFFEFRNNRAVTKCVTSQDLADLFCNIEEIFEAHHDFIWDVQTSLDTPLVSIGVPLQNFIPRLSAYIPYISNINRAKDTHQRLSKLKAVAAVIRQCEEKDRSGLDMIGLLMAPSRHVKIYKDIMEEIFNNTNTTDADYDHLDEALEMLNELNEKMDNAEKVASGYRLVAAIVQRFEHSNAVEDILSSSPGAPARFVLKESSGSGLFEDVQPVVAFLFSDLLLIAEKAGMDTSSLKLRRRITLTSVTGINEGPSDNTVQIEIGKEPLLTLTFSVLQDRNDWLQALTEAIRIHNQSRVFGVALVDLMESNKLYQDHDVPPFVVTALDAIDTNGLEVEGIFRVSGSVLTIRMAKEAINQGMNIDFNSYDIHSIAGIVQTWLRELPDPLMTYDLYHDWVAAARSTEPAENIKTLREVVFRLPPYHRFTLHHLMRFLHRVSSFAKVNKMKSGNLALVLGPSILAQSDTAILTAPLQDVYAVVQVLIDYENQIFEGVEAERDDFLEMVQKNKENKKQQKIEERKKRREEMKLKRATRDVHELKDSAGLRRAEEQRLERRVSRDVERQKKYEKELEEKIKLKEEEDRQAAEYAAKLEEEKRASKLADEETRKKKAEVLEEKFKMEMDQLSKVEEERRAQRQKEKEELEQLEKEREEKERERALEAARLEEEELIKKELQRIKEQEEAELKKQILEKLPKCEKCGEPIEDEGISTGGKTWHKACFVCAVCNKPIQGSFATQDDKFTCGSCHNQQASNKNVCFVCGKTLSGRVVRVGDPPVRLHKDCFKCAGCETSLEEGYFEKNDKLWCENCISKQ